MLLESSRGEGGSLDMDVMGRMRALLPNAMLYAWSGKTVDFEGGRVHAKVAVADYKTCLITSANLTGHALEKNIEVGVLLTGGSLPQALHQHLECLVKMQLITLS